MAKMTDTEAQTRETLAQCYHLAAKFGWTDLIFTHISARIPDQEGVLLINPFGYLYEQITPENLVKIDYAGNILHAAPDTYVNVTGYVIHSAIHQARPESICVMHTHTIAGMALSTLKCGLLPITQHACRFYNRIGYHDFNGLVVDNKEQPQLVKDLGKHKAMILRNHGLITVGRTIPEAFTLMHFLDRAAQAQLHAMATHSKLITPSSDVCEKAAQQFGDDYTINGDYEWQALLKTLKSN